MGFSGKDAFRLRGLLLLFTFSFPILLSCSGFAWFLDEPRYLLPLYSVLFLIVADGFTSLGGWGRRMLPVVSVVWIGYNLVGASWITPQQFAEDMNTESMRPLEEYLERTGVTRVFASYRVAYRLSFETDERIIATPLPDDTMRYEPFWNAVRASKRRRIHPAGLPTSPWGQP